MTATCAALVAAAFCAASAGCQGDHDAKPADAAISMPVGGTPLEGAQLEAFSTWRHERLEALRSPDGWLTLIGLYWLEPGENLLGSGGRNDLVLPDHPALAQQPETLARLTLTRERTPVSEPRAASDDGHDAKLVTLAVEPGAEMVAVGGDHESAQPLLAETQVVLWPPAEDVPLQFEVGPIVSTVIERGGQLALRVRDRSIDTEARLGEIETWEPSRHWQVSARFEAWQTPRHIEVPNVTPFEYPQLSTGQLVFELGGRTHRIEVLGDDLEAPMFLVIGDETNGSSSYPGGRYVYAPPPDEGGLTEIDFNRLYNPPCAFTAWATCPLPPPGNQLPVAIEAGEKAVPH